VGHGVWQEVARYIVFEQRQDVLLVCEYYLQQEQHEQWQ
jgi:hypothetical protein